MAAGASVTVDNFGADVEGWLAWSSGLKKCFYVEFDV